MNPNSLVKGLSKNNIKSLARSISIVENEAKGYRELLEKIEVMPIPVIGITGPPGSGKSSLLNSILSNNYFQDKTIGIIAVDPSSPFNYGALLGDRIRINKTYKDRRIYFRSLASRGSLGGLSEKIIEVLEILKSFDFDMIFVETVGVGQSEVEIAGLADVTVVILTPESGEQVQSMKAGLMEIADLFVVNKCDHPHAVAFIKNLQQVLTFNKENKIAVVEFIATQEKGVDEFINQLKILLSDKKSKSKRMILLAEKIFQIIQKRRMEVISREKIVNDLKEMNISELNIYKYIKNKYSDLFDL